METNLQILNKVSIKYMDLNDDWGSILNELQDIAWDNLPKKSVKRFSTQAQNDANKCEGMDCILLNGHVFDWKEFSYKGREIILAYLEYFTEEELKIINNKIKI